MTIASEIMKTRYVGDGVAKNFDATWKVDSADEVGLFLINTSVTPNTYAAITSNFTITPTEGSYPSVGVTVNYPTTGVAITSDYELLLIRDVRLLQSVAFSFGGTYNPTYMEKVLDAVVMEIQQVNEVASRAVRVPVATDTDAVSPVLPYPSANKIIAWNSTGSGLENIDMQEKVDAASASSAAASASAASASASASSAAASFSSLTAALDSAVATATSQAAASATAAALSLSTMNETLGDAVADATGEAAGSASSAASYMSTAGGHADAASSSATAASASASASSAAASASSAAADIAADSALSAQESAVTAAAYSAPAWNVGTTYNYPDAVVYTDGYAYRCVGTGVVGVVPTDSASWVQIITSIENFWKYDTDGDVTMNETGTYSTNWYRDGNGDLSMKA